MKKEIKVLKELVKAQDKIITNYRIGKRSIPEWCFNKILRAKAFYMVKNISDIK